jgi:hypothetical protein
MPNSPSDPQGPTHPSGPGPDQDPSPAGAPGAGASAASLWSEAFDGAPEVMPPGTVKSPSQPVADPAEGSTVADPRHRDWSGDDVAVAVLAVAGGLVGLFAAGWPTLNPVVDGVFRALLGLAVTAAASRAHRWSLLVLGGVAAALSGVSIGALFGWTALVLAFASVLFDWRRRPLGAAIGLCSIIALFHLPSSIAPALSVVGVAVAVAPVLVSAYRLQRGRARRVLRLAVGGSAVLLGVMVGAFAVALVIGGSEASQGLSQARAGLAAARTGDTDTMNRDLRRAVADFDSAHAAFAAWYVTPSRSLPVLGYHARAFLKLSAAGQNLSRSALEASSHADYRSIDIVDGRIDIAKIQGLRAPLVDVSHALQQATGQVDGIDVHWLLPPLSGRVVALRHELAQASDETSTAIQAVEVAPAVLGSKGPRHYFIAFVNPAESRGSDGLMGNWAVLTADQGKLSLTRSGRAAVLALRPKAPVRTLTAPADYLARYGPYHPENDLRDVTLSPDFPSVAQAIESVYPQAPGGTPIDGVLAIDPYAIAAMLKITGPVNITGLPTPLTSANAADYLVRRQYLEFDPTDENKARLDVLDDAGRRTFEAFLHTKSLRPAQLGHVFEPVVAQHRLLAMSSQPAEESFIRRIGMDGTFPAHPTADFLSLVTQNSGNNKMDIYLHRSTTYDVTYDPRTGAVQATVTVRLHNDAPSSGLPAYVIANRPDSHQPDGANWMWFNLYTPHQLASATLDGNPLNLVGQSEFGMNVYETHLAVPSHGDAVVVVHLTGHVAPSATYSFGWYQQAMVNADQVTVRMTPAQPWRAAGHQPGQSVSQVLAPGQIRYDVGLRRS